MPGIPMPGSQSTIFPPCSGGILMPGIPMPDFPIYVEGASLCPSYWQHEPAEISTSH